ncbi:PQQ-binding-like beta-propeller repeat protein [Actinoplanes sp. M2I2]|uniref:outer membrane protein assembly factor BamB family protein n=1 Tax=Actinoplanes sp. M2I2 TaxID=1734444 RepID=UPI00202291CC|nr:PQQ-binding-like beta-propeller repeat protein [Actinoplanes sp. M2I2]
MSTIELGEIPTADGDPPAPTGPVRLDRRLVRQVAVVLAAILCAVALTGSEVPRDRGVHPLWSVRIADAQGTALTGDAVFVYRIADGSTSFTAHDLATGAVRWRHTIDGAIGYVQPAETAGMLLIPTQARLVKLPSPNDGSAYQAEIHGETVALSAATGAELWRTTGEPYLVSGDTALLTEYDARAKPARMRLIRLSDRGTIWSRDTSGVDHQSVLPSGEQPEKIVTADDTGQIKIYAYASGALVSEGRIPWVYPRPEEGYFNDLSGTGDVLVVNRSQAETFDLSVYRIDTMTKLWQASDTDGGASGCGVALCINDGSGVAAYDPVTGARLWRAEGLANAWQLTRDRVVVSEGVDGGLMQLVDAATGRVVGEPVEGTLAWSETEQRSAIVLRSTRSPQDRTAVTRWDLTTGRQWLLGTVAAVGGPPCSVKPGYLACIHGDDYEINALP